MSRMGNRSSGPSRTDSKKSNGKGRGAHAKLPRFEAGGRPQTQPSHFGFAATTPDGPHSSRWDRNKKGQFVAAAARPRSCHSTESPPGTPGVAPPMCPAPNERREFRSRIPKERMEYLNAYGATYIPPGPETSVSEGRLIVSIVFNAETRQEIETYEILDDSKESTPVQKEIITV